MKVLGIFVFFLFLSIFLSVLINILLDKLPQALNHLLNRLLAPGPLLMTKPLNDQRASTILFQAQSLDL